MSIDPTGTPDRVSALRRMVRSTVPNGAMLPAAFVDDLAVGWVAEHREVLEEIGYAARHVLVEANDDIAKARRILAQLRDTLSREAKQMVAFIPYFQEVFFARTDSDDAEFVYSLREMATALLPEQG